MPLNNKFLNVKKKFNDPLISSNYGEILGNLNKKDFDEGGGRGDPVITNIFILRKVGEHGKASSAKITTILTLSV